jgi:mannitol-1-/sugar-/sorbitol-6-phosphatase
MALSVSSSPVLVRCQGILFDMDGILISSLGSVERSWTKWAGMRGIDPESSLKTAHGRRAIETVAMLRPDLDSEAELKILEDLEIADNEDLRALPGVCELLRSLPADRWTVVTSATEKLALARLADGGIPVPARLVTANQVTRGKPHPEPFLAGAALLGFRPEDCVVFEDSASGVIAGRAAGCTVIATTFSHPVESLEAAHYLVEDLTGVTAEWDEGEVLLKFVPLASGK